MSENKNIFTLYNNANCSYCLEWTKKDSLLGVLVLRSKGTENGGKPLWAHKASWVPHFFRPTFFNGRNSVMIGSNLEGAKVI